MRRWILLALMFVLPMQFVWGAAASYCRHETTTTKHFGHHQHQHAAAASTVVSDDGSASIGVEHPDCGMCHLGASATVPMPEVSMPAPIALAEHADEQAGFRSYFPPGLERPNI